MGSNWYQIASILALLFSVVLFWELSKLRKFLHWDDLTPHRKWRKAINGSRYVPKHKIDKLSGYETDHDKRFLNDFAKVSDLLNIWNPDSPWSFENNGQIDSGLGSQNGTEREIEIRYNQQKTGVITLSCIDCAKAYTAQEVGRTGKIRMHLELINARHFEGYEVFHLANSLWAIVDGEPETRQTVNSEIMMAMINACWQVGEKVFGNPPLDLSIFGNAHWYLKEWLPNQL